MPLTLYGCGYNGFSQLDGFKCLKFNELGLVTSDKHSTRIKSDQRTKMALPEQLIQLSQGYSLNTLLITWARAAATLTRGTDGYTSVITGLINMTSQEADSQGEASILDGQVVMASTDTDILLRGFEDGVPSKISYENTTEPQSVTVVLPSEATKLSLVCGGHHNYFAVYDSVTVGKLHVSDKEVTKNTEDRNTNENIEETHFNLHSVDSGVEIKEISCGKEHVLILAHVGTVYSYGLGSRGQLGHYSVEPETSPRLLASLEGLRMSSVCAGGWHSAAVSDYGDVYMWGWNESGQLGVSALSKAVSNSSATEDEERVGIQTEPLCITMLPDELNISAVACGSRHSVILSDTGRVFACGWNAYGQLGLGDTESRDRFTEIAAFKGHCVKIFAGQWNSFFVCNSNKYCV